MWINKFTIIFLNFLMDFCQNVFCFWPFSYSFLICSSIPRKCICHSQVKAESLKQAKTQKSFCYKIRTCFKVTAHTLHISITVIKMIDSEEWKYARQGFCRYLLLPWLEVTLLSLFHLTFTKSTWCRLTGFLVTGCEYIKGCLSFRRRSLTIYNLSHLALTSGWRLSINFVNGTKAWKKNIKNFNVLNLFFKDFCP